MKVVKIKVGAVEYVLPESAVANYHHLLIALRQQGSSETLHTETQKLSSDMGTEETQGSVEASGSEQASPRRTQRKGV